MQTKRNMQIIVKIIACLGLAAGMTQAENLSLESPTLRVQIETDSGRWSLLDKRSQTMWPTQGMARCGIAGSLRCTAADEKQVCLGNEGGDSVTFKLANNGTALDLQFKAKGETRALEDALTLTDVDQGYVIVPCREGLLIPSTSGQAFARTFGTSEYEGVHMNMLGYLKAGSGLIVTWEDAYVFPEIQSVLAQDGPFAQVLRTTFKLRHSNISLRITPMGKANWNALASAYRDIARDKGLVVTLKQKIKRNPNAALFLGASDVKLWTCLARRMSEDSTHEESVKVHWTFDEAAQIAEHLKQDLAIDRCLFMIGGWTEGGYDCRHPDNLPANPECGGNAGLSDAVKRIQDLGYLACLHDNYQDMYRDARSWDEGLIEKRADGSLVKGGRWLGGRAYMVCAPKQLELARRPQNLPGIQALFPVTSYFIDTTYAVGPRECYDPSHPIGRNEDIQWKIRLSDYARGVFGLFGSECGREWALAHSDFFEGLVGVSGRTFHNLKPAQFGATVIPFWEMVYHDCQICYGKYGYAPENAAQYVAHHVLCARPLHYHSLGDHLYWKASEPGQGRLALHPGVAQVDPVDTRSFRIRYAWKVDRDMPRDWRIFVHFGTARDILFQDDHRASPPLSTWKANSVMRIGPHLVHIPSQVKRDSVNVYMGLFDPASASERAALPGADSQRRVLVGRLRLTPSIRFEPNTGETGLNSAVYLRSDGGWAAGMHPMDVFIKNTHEVLGPLHAATAHQVLTDLEFMSEDRTLRRAVYGQGAQAAKVVVNFGTQDAKIQTKLGGQVLLPPWGFTIEAPAFAAFYARQWGGESYPDGALFTLRALSGNLKTSGVRVFHGFGRPVIRWNGSTHQVKRELTIPGAGQ